MKKLRNFHGWSAFLLAPLCLGGCALFAITPPPKVPTTVCVIKQADGMCWIDKASNQGTKIEMLDGYFGVSPQDMNQILGRMSSCKEQSQ